MGHRDPTATPLKQHKTINAPYSNLSLPDERTFKVLSSEQTYGWLESRDYPNLSPYTFQNINGQLNKFHVYLDRLIATLNTGYIYICMYIYSNSLDKNISYNFMT